MFFGTSDLAMVLIAVTPTRPRMDKEMSTHLRALRVADIERDVKGMKTKESQRIGRI